MIEVDGSQHAEAIGKDQVRDEFLKNAGYRVRRFWNNEVLEQIDVVVEEIVRELGLCATTSNPSPP